MQLIIPLEEKFDEKVINSAFQKIVESKTENMQTHFIYAGYHYYQRHRDYYELQSFILEAMKKYKIKKVMLTVIGGYHVRLKHLLHVEPH